MKISKKGIEEMKPKQLKAIRGGIKKHSDDDTYTVTIRVKATSSVEADCETPAPKC
ncbi:hypothetical protein KORDIASMS9_00849 [Kordia sp. SMS9]|uniref:hypothetical protein n=1 Tax=Kordia sp. SMS9 TaxID=2282170 RepID=UPI000E10B430|nr:hypothetical protein [Kordia sp. SMS9]AXG68633.1 hypothetical protein KORDIASMS9_00849 [Kordia sp. SMS9]